MSDDKRLREAVKVCAQVVLRWFEKRCLNGRPGHRGSNLVPFRKCCLVMFSFAHTGTTKAFIWFCRETLKTITEVQRTETVHCFVCDRTDKGSVCQWGSNQRVVPPPIKSHQQCTWLFWLDVVNCIECVYGVVLTAHFNTIQGVG